MATAEKASREVEECRCLLQGMAKNLVDRLYGPEGPPWSTSFCCLEDIALRLADRFRKGFLDLALARQANAFLHDCPDPLCLCPSCGLLTLPKDPEPRLLFCRAATVEWCEPHRYCRKCRKAFFPQSRSLGIDQGHYSCSLLDLIAYTGANNPSFREASLNLSKVGRVLDWGCGSGRVTAHWVALRPGPEVHGCDIDADAIAWCNDQLRPGAFTRIEP